MALLTLYKLGKVIMLPSLHMGSCRFFDLFRWEIRNVPTCHF